jgi:hypothetical protein
LEYQIRFQNVWLNMCNCRHCTKIVFYLFYISHFIKGLQINKDVAIICMSNVQTLDWLQYMHCQKYTPPILMINGLQLLHILMMFNIGLFIFCGVNFQFYLPISSWYLYNSTFDMVWVSMCYTCNTPMSQCCMSEHFVKFHDECTHMCYW